MATIETTITLGEDELSNVRLMFVCETCNEQAEVDPTFFQNSGNPICSGLDDSYDCDGDDMIVYAVTVVTSAGAI